MKGVTGFLAVMLAIGALAMARAADPSAGTMVKVLRSGIAHDAIFGLSFDGPSGVAVGSGGRILESANAGASWTSVEQAEPQLALLAVSRRGGHSIAVGQMGLVLVEDSPATWKKYDSGVDHRLLAVSVNASGLAVATGEFGTVMESTDGGRTWESHPPDWESMALADTFGTGEPTIYAVDVSDAGVITIAGEFGVLARSTNRGITWKVIRGIQPSAPSIFALSVVPAVDGNSYAVGQTGQILVSKDAGLTWKNHSIRTDTNLLGVAGLKDGRVVVSGMRTMLQSLDGGSTWSFIVNNDTTTEWYQTVRAVPEANRILAVGHDGRIIEIGG